MPTPIGPGARLGPYEILSLVGAGGMGEVYRARDPRLGRDVAVKILPAAVSSDPERLARFEQEARATAALNHPNILAVYDIGSADGVAYVVSELLDGETLRDALVHGALPTRQSIDYSVQIAHGLAAAHEKTIVHRDLKPENVFVTRDGRVKILDFGLAKLIEGSAAISGTMMPTTPMGTAAGMIVGTVGYMAPEQIRGAKVDGRADIFAFGAILYEMLTGERAFAGETPPDTISAILKEDPPQISNASKLSSPALQRVVQRCLEKKAEQRFHSAHDLAYAIEAAATQVASGVVPAAPTASRAPGRSTLLGVVAGIATVAALLLLVVAARHWSERPSFHVVRFAIPLPEGTMWSLAAVPFAVSQDGQFVAMTLESANGARIWVRRLDSFETRVVTGTEGANGTPIWSPDSQNVAFIASGRLKRVSIAGGPVQTLWDTSKVVGPTMIWGPDDMILISTVGAAPIVGVSASTGAARQLTKFEAGDQFHFLPDVAPGDRRFIFALLSSSSMRAGTYLASLDGGEMRRLWPEVGVTIAGDYVAYLRDRSIMIQGFDAAKFSLRGEPAVVADDVRVAQTVSRRAAMSVSRSKYVLAYVTGQNQSRLTWVDRAGREVGRVGDPGDYTTLALSRDGSRVAFTRMDPRSNTRALWIADLSRNVSSRPAADGGQQSDPAWSPSGDRLAFTSQDEHGKAIRIIASAGGDQLTVRTTPSVNSGVDDWSRDGRYLLYHDAGQISAIEVSGEHRSTLIHRTSGRPPDEGAFSPDSRAVAFNTEETGRSEVYLKAFPPTGQTWQLSNNGGMQPRWREDGRELYYLAPDGTMMVVDISAPPPNLKASAPRPLFKTRVTPAYQTDQYAVTADGQRFLLAEPIVDERLLPLRVVLDWPGLLDRR